MKNPNLSVIKMHINSDFIVFQVIEIGDFEQFYLHMLYRVTLESDKCDSHIFITLSKCVNPQENDCP